MDPIARLLSQKFSESFGQQLVVDNRPGAGTTIGVEIASRAPADGYTLLLGGIANTISYSLYSKLSFDLNRDFAPITLLATSPGVVVAHPALPAKSIQDLVKLAKSRPGQVNYSSSGNGGFNHLAGELFALMSGVQLVHVPYKGGGPSMTALLSGEVSLAFTSLPSAIGQIKAGKMRALAVTSEQRTASMPDLPTVSEAGVAGYEAELWFGLMAPARTPADIVTRLNTEMHKILATPDVTDRLSNLGYRTRTSTSEEYAAFTRREIEKWAKVIKAAKMRAD